MWGYEFVLIPTRRPPLLFCQHDLTFGTRNALSSLSLHVQAAAWGRRRGRKTARGHIQPATIYQYTICTCTRLQHFVVGVHADLHAHVRVHKDTVRSYSKFPNLQQLRTDCGANHQACDDGLASIKATWSRNYIRRAAADSREFGEPTAQRVATSRRLRTATALICAVDGFKFNSIGGQMNIHQLRTFAEAGVEAFAGVTTELAKTTLPSAGTMHSPSPH